MSEFEPQPGPYKIANDPSIRILQHTRIPFIRCDDDDPFVAGALSAIRGLGADYQEDELRNVFAVRPETPSWANRMLSLCRMGVQVVFGENIGDKSLSDLAEDPDLLRNSWPEPAIEALEEKHPNKHAWYYFEAERLQKINRYMDADHELYPIRFLNAPGEREILSVLLFSRALIHLLVSADELFPEEQPSGTKASLLITGLAQEVKSKKTIGDEETIVSEGVIAHCACAAGNNNFKDIYVPWQYVTQAHQACSPAQRFAAYMSNGQRLYKLPEHWDSYEKHYGDESSQKELLYQPALPHRSLVTEAPYQTIGDTDSYLHRYSPFYENYADYCLPAAVGTAANPISRREYTPPDEFYRKLCKHIPGHGAAFNVVIPELVDLGYEVRWLSHFNKPLDELASREGYLDFLRQTYQGNEAAYQRQLAMLNEERLTDQLAAFQKCYERGIGYENRIASFEDIMELVRESYSIIMSVDGNELFSRKPGLKPLPHAIAAFGTGTAPDPKTGRSVQGLICHNSHALYGKIPYQFISRYYIQKARRSGSSHMPVIAIRSKEFMDACYRLYETTNSFE